MILLKQVRLINWYAFSCITAPIGYFTLVAGKNGNGKSVFLDALKYGAFGDTVFNKSTDKKGTRTLPTYTRGLLDATSGTYIRPADKVPNVCTHIVLEFYDDVNRKSFLLGTILETGSTNNIQTVRYVMDHMTLDEVSHTYEENGVSKPMSAAIFQKKYNVAYFHNKEQGIAKFTQMTGLKMTAEQTQTYLRKLHGIMSYDPDARIDQFIRNSVLENKPVDFGKLIEAKENIGRLNDTLSGIQTEIEELDAILGTFSQYENQKNLLLIDNIKRTYKAKLELSDTVESQKQARDLCAKECGDAGRMIAILKERLDEAVSARIETLAALRKVDGTELILRETERLKKLESERDELDKARRQLAQFQTQVSEMMRLLTDGGSDVPGREVLAALTESGRTAAEKEQAVEGLQEAVSDFRDSFVGKLAAYREELRKKEELIAAQIRIVEDCRKNQNAFESIPDYVGLKNEINREFAKRGIQSEARFACEYVSGFRDEKWRDAIETFLGRRRYTILVDPEHYEIADEVLNRSKNRYAHLFNTALLMKKEIHKVEDSAADLLEIRSEVARRYFDYQLGQLHAVPVDEVKRYENAISVEGRVSVSMDSYFLNFAKLRFYYLGQETFRLNRLRAEKRIKELRAEAGELDRQIREAGASVAQLNLYQKCFRPYRYDAEQLFQETLGRIRESEKELKRLQDAQASNTEFIELSQQLARIESEMEAVQKQSDELTERRVSMQTKQTDLERQILSHEAQLAETEEEMKRHRTEHFEAAKKAMEAYDRFLENGRKGPGGILQESSRRRNSERIEEYKGRLIELQSVYRVKRQEAGIASGLEEEARSAYAARKNRIWMDDLQEVRAKLTEQTRRYEDIFKNEFVLTILRSCEKAREDLRAINRELAKLDFPSSYAFDVHYLKDQSDFAKVIEYAKYLDEREQLGSADGQMTLDGLTSFSSERADQLEKEMSTMITRVIGRNDASVIADFADYRNYMTYDILVTNASMNRAKLSRQTGYNSGAEVQIPYILILSSALLMIYNEKLNSTRFILIDEPFAKMDPGNVRVMLNFFREQNFQVIFCAPDKTETIGNACEVILPVLRVRPELMEMGSVQFHEV